MQYSARKDLLWRIRRLLSRESILAMGRTAPNPPVAAVVLATESDTDVLFSGGTEPAGSRHAEIVALDRVRDAGSIPGKMYVTLEPCSHHGRTPPCTQRIIEADVARVVVYTRDPALGESGIDLLRRAGRRVHLNGAGRFAPGRDFLAGFLGRIAGRGPRYHIKAALTADGFMTGGADRERLLISGRAALAFGMALRSRVDAAVVGPGTVAGDLPGLELRPVAFAFDFEEHAAAAERTGDGFLAALFEHFNDITGSFSDPRYQPDRIFLLGRPFPGADDFFTKQARLAEVTGRKAVFVTTQKHAEHWGDMTKTVLPDMSASDFASALRNWLGERGYNEVMIEGGPTLLETLAPNMGGTDRIYLLKSRTARAGRGRSFGAAMDEHLRQPTSTYDFGESDVLEVYP